MTLQEGHILLNNVLNVLIVVNRENNTPHNA